MSLQYSCSKSDSTGTQDPPAPQTIISSIFPTRAKGGDTIKIVGKYLLQESSTPKILINKKEAQILSLSNDSILAKVPAKAGAGNVELIAGSKTYSGPEFSYEYIITVTTIAGNGSQGNSDGIGFSASFKAPWGITVDNNGDLFIADSYNRLIRKITASNNMVSSITIPTFVGTSTFYSPYNITIDRDSKSLYVTDFNDHLLKINSAGNMSVILNDVQPLTGVGISPDKKIYLTNNTTGQLIRIDTSGQNKSVYLSGLTTPRNIIFDKDSLMYVAGVGIYKVALNNSFSQVLPDPAQFKGWEIALDTALNIFYEADHFNNRIRMIDKKGNINVIAGNGIAADIDGIGLNSSFDGPCGITIDKDGNLYVTTYNFTTSTGNKVRKITVH